MKKRNLIVYNASMPAGRIFSIIFALILFSCFLVPGYAFATPEYARQTGLECGACHVDAMGGGALTRQGMQFLDNLKAQGRYRPLSTAQRVVRLGAGYLHLMAAIMWFGTIMYVHVLLKPAYASKGLPKGELRLGWAAMIVTLVTGAFLTIARVPSWHMLYSTRFGILLSIKIFLFILMFVSALIVTVYIGPKLRQKLKSPVAASLARDITSESIAYFDGKEGRPAYIAYKGIVYDVTDSRLWKNGVHVMKHAAGNDLTDLLKTAPHGEDKVLTLPRVGMLAPVGQKPVKPFHERLFYFFAYMNLVLVFVITLIVALWRWW